MPSDPRDWPFPDNFGRRWRAGSLIVQGSVLLLAKAVMRLSQRVQYKNYDLMKWAIFDRPTGTPLITVCNHVSFVDDPGVWGAFSLRMVTEGRMRWIPGAKEYTFVNKVANFVFSRGQVVPVVRGEGVHQRGMDHCLDQLNKGGWVHIYPEGKINCRGEALRYKWGVGRLIAEAKTLPIVIPFWHVGMEDILPNTKPYCPRFLKKLTVFVGEPIDFSAMVKQYTPTAVELRKHLTDTIQHTLGELKASAHALHDSWHTTFPVQFRTL
ncbi:hypothetical protein EMCRGX_G025492 [Ephydatia muelleri]